jgi:hypothetical protein
MEMAIEEYYGSSSFDPIRATFLDRIADMRIELERPWWTEQPSALGKTLQVWPAVPGFEDRPPTIETFEPVFSEPVLPGNLLPFRFEQQPAWDTFGIGLLQRDPGLQPLWTELLAGNPMGAWDDFRSSTEFAPTVETLGLSARGLLKQGKKLVGKGVGLAKRHGPDAARFVTGLRRLTPMGFAAWAAKEIVIDAGVDWLQNHWDELTPPPGPNPRPPVRPHQNLAFTIPAAQDWGMPLAAPVDLSSVLEGGFNDLADMFGTAVDTVGDVVDGAVDWLIGVGEEIFL